MLAYPIFSFNGPILRKRMQVCMKCHTSAFSSFVNRSHCQPAAQFEFFVTSYTVRVHSLLAYTALRINLNLINSYYNSHLQTDNGSTHQRSIAPFAGSGTVLTSGEAFRTSHRAQRRETRPKHIPDAAADLESLVKHDLQKLQIGNNIPLEKKWSLEPQPVEKQKGECEIQTKLLL
jgi:hypothetical protein